jgi:hypothetical protein
VMRCGSPLSIFRLLVLSYFVPSPISFSILHPIFNFFCLEHPFYPRRQ